MITLAADGKVKIQVILEDGSVAKGIANINDQFKGLDSTAKKGSGSILDMAKSFGLVKVASVAIDAVKNSLDSAISRFDTMQKFPKVMDALGFSAEDSEKSISKLSDGIDGLPTKLDDVVASTQQMTAITGDLDRSTDTVIALNNAFLASGASTEDASRGMQQFNQMLSTGTVDLESWKTLQETMPLALQKTAEAMGYTGKSAQRDLYAALKSGEVTFDEFNNNIIKLGTGTGMLADLAKENSLGIATSFGNLSNAVAKNVANIITKFDEITQKLTGKTIAENIDSIKGIINDFGGFVVSSMDGILPALEAFSNSSVWFDITYWFGLIGQSGEENIGKLFDVISDKVPAILDYFTSLYEDLKEPIWQIMGTIYLISETVIQVFTTLLPPILDIAGAVWQKLSDAILPILKGIVDAVVEFADALKIWITETALPALEGFFTYISENETVIDVLAGAIAAAGGAFLAFKGYLAITSLISGVAKAIGILNTAFTILSNVGLKGVIGMITGFMGPIGWIVLAIGAVIGVIVYLWNTNEGFRDAVKAIWAAIVDVFKKSWEWIKEAWSGTKEFFSDIWQGISDGVDAAVDWIVNAWTSSVDWIVNAWNGFIDFFANLWQGTKDGASTAAEGITSAWEGFKNFFVELWQGIVDGATTAWTAITTGIMMIVQPFIDYFMTLWNNVKDGISLVWEGITSIFTGVWELIKSIFMGAVLIIIDLVTGNFDQLKLDLDLIWSHITEAITLIWEGIKSYFSGVISIIVGYVTTQFETLKNVLTTIWQFISDTAVIIWNSIKTAITNLIQGAITTATNLWNGFKNFLSNLWSAITTGATNAWNALKNGVVNLVNGTISTASNAWNGFKSFMSGLWEGIKSTAISMWEGLKTSVVNIINGLVDGAKQAWEILKQSVSDVVSNVTGLFEGLANIDLFGAGKAIIDGFLGGLKNAFEGVKDFVGGIADWIRDNKGPIEYDRKLLIPAGKAIMNSLDKGLQDQFRKVQRTIAAITDTVQSDFEIRGNVSADRFVGTPSAALNVGASQIIAAASTSAASTEALVNVNIDATVEMDSKSVGKLVAPTVKATNEKEDRLNAKINGGK